MSFNKCNYSTWSDLHTIVFTEPIHNFELILFLTTIYYFHILSLSIKHKNFRGFHFLIFRMPSKNDNLASVKSLTHKTRLTCKHVIAWFYKHPFLTFHLNGSWLHHDELFYSIQWYVAPTIIAITTEYIDAVV